MADVGDQRPTTDSPTTPFRKIVLPPPAEETAQIQRPPAPGRPAPQAPPQRPRPQPPSGPQPPQQERKRPPVTPHPAPGPVPPEQGAVPTSLPPLPPTPPRRGLGDIPIKVVYLAGAIIATVAAVLLVFLLFSGDVPENRPQRDGEDVAGVEPAPTGTAAPGAGASASAGPSASPVALPPVPASKAFRTLSGTASAVVGTITDKATGISYPRLAAPWKARSYPPYTVAQRIGKVEMPYTLIASAMYPGESPSKKPSSSADYRALAAEAVRWTIRTQYPEGATVEWTASQKLAAGKGWTLGYKVTYTRGGAREVAQALVALVEVGKAKPGMLMASIPEPDKARWRDLNTLAQQVRPL
ncbi:hypothetical protein MF672_045705 [Actinomadura sp. ATCC 31491]|uniref:Uncharacterized protein n=1 Tax=Actinomadura luzonensis TaxID=2805427 RepID=A0ABT0G8Z2_9ACTN|nr:hypothetical protein [Actinomadura luzonensis]MCK2221052.1 hypothetical protein [Actinomadura luzonensis]